MAIIKETLPFTYDEIYQDIAKRLIEKGWDGGAYEGSNGAILASVLSYIVSSLNFNTAVNVNENVLTLATKRKNVIQDARVLSYEPSHKKSTILEITLSFTRTGYFKIPKYSTFAINGFTYNYLGDDLEFNIDKIGATTTIQVKEGTLIKNEEYPDILTYKIDEKFEYIDIPWNDVEDDGVECYVTYYDTFGNLSDNATFVKSSFNLIDIKDSTNNKFFRKDDVDTGNARIYFQLGTAGTKLPSNTRVYINVLRTSGKDAYYERCDSASVNGDLGSFCKILTSGKDVPVLVSQAQDEESIESIKTNAPMFYNSASRTVTIHDYNSVIKTHSSVKNVVTWGGEDEYPVAPGNLYFSAEPRRKEPEFTIFKKVQQSDGTYTYKKENSALANGELLNTTETSTNQYYIKESYNDPDTLYLNDGEVVSAEKDANGYKNPGIFDLVDTYNLPALKNNLKNPTYVNIDLQVLIKQYPFGVPKSDIRKKIYAKIREKMAEIEKFEGEFIHSNLVRHLDNELGLGNGIEVKPYFSLLLSEENCVKQFKENKDFSKVNCFYTKSYDKLSKNLVLSVYFSLLASVGDKLEVYFNKESLPFILDNTDHYTYELTDTDVNQSYKSFYFKDVGFDEESLNVRIVSYDGLTTYGGNDINLYNLKNKTVFFNVNIGNELSVIKIALPRFVSVGDSFKVYGLYGSQKAEQLIYDFYITEEMLSQGYLQCDDLQRGQYAGFVGASDYKVVYTCNKESLKPSDDEGPDSNGLKSNQLLGTASGSWESAVNQTESQDNVFGDIETSNLYYNWYEDSDGQIDIRVWIPSSVKANDTLLIDYVQKTTSITITDAMIAQRQFDTKIDGILLDITKISFGSADGSIGIYPTYVERQNELTPVEDDRIQFVAKQFENITEYTPTTTFDREVQLKSNEKIVFYVNYNNKFDVRNLIANHDDSLDSYTVSIPEDSPLKYEAPYIVLNNYRKTGTFNFNLDVQIKRGDLLYQNQIVYVKEAAVDLSVDEGPGGAYVYLDFPVEGIYDAKGQIIPENIPVIEWALFAKANPAENEDNEPICFEEIQEPNKTHKVIPADLTGYVADQKIVANYVIDEESVKTMLPFYTTVEEYINLDLSKVAYIRIPIKLVDRSAATPEEGEQIVGSYTIFNSRIPYIRVKFQTKIFQPGYNYEFMLNYPSHNFKLIRNSIFRLRSVVFDDLLDYQEVRDSLRAGDIDMSTMGV